MTGVVVDAHVHLWDVRRMRLSWFRPDLGLPAAATLEDLREAAGDGTAPGAPGPLRRAIAVQAADTLREAQWLAGLAAANPFMGAVVLQYDAGGAARGSWAGMAQSLIDPPGDATVPSRARIAGIRLATPAGAADFSDIRGLDALADGLAATGRVLELLIRPEQLRAAAALARRHPALTVVLCHLAIGGEQPDAAWRAGLDAVAARPNAAAKVSGLVRARPGDDERVGTIVRHAVDVLGVDRLAFGSDWPISARFATYGDVVRRTAAAFPHPDASFEHAFWSGTATRLYGLGAADPATAADSPASAT